MNADDCREASGSAGFASLDTKDGIEVSYDFGKFSIVVGLFAHSFVLLLGNSFGEEFVGTAFAVSSASG